MWSRPPFNILELAPISIIYGLVVMLSTPPSRLLAREGVGARSSGLNEPLKVGTVRVRDTHEPDLLAPQRSGLCAQL